MKRVLLSTVLGLFVGVVFLGVGELLSVPGQNTIRGILGASLAGTVYLAVSQFFVAPRGSRSLGSKWSTMVAMGAPLLAIFLQVNVAEHGRAWLYDALPLFVPGCLGIVAGAAAAGRVTFSALPLESCRRNLRACAALLAGVALVLAAAVIPLTRKAGTFPDGAPGKAVAVFWAITILAILVSAFLAFIAVRARCGRRPSFIVLGFLAFLALVPACFLVIPAIWFVGHGPVLRAVSILSPLCSLAGFAVTALLGATALRLPETERA